MRQNTQELSRPVALIFDMDGVLIDSEALHVRSKRDALHAAGIVVPHDRFASYTGRSDKIMIDDLAAEYGLTAEQGDEILKQKHRIYESLEHELQPVDGAVEFVHWARQNFRLALATSANQRNRIAHTEHLGISSLFETAVDSARFLHPKPSPEVFQIAMADMGLQPSECWVIEDATTGVIAAKAAGCTAVGITTSFSVDALLEAGADLVIHNFDELRKALACQHLVHMADADAFSWPGLRREVEPAEEHSRQSRLRPAAA